MKTISFASIKGGTGKSSLTILTANGLAAQGFRVLVIDMDIQNSSTFYYLDDADAVEQWNVARALQTQKLAGNIIPTNRRGIDLLGSCFELVDLRAVSDRRLSLLLPDIACNYDYCIIDTAPTYDNLVLNAINASDLIVTPVAQSQFDFKSARFLSAKLALETEKADSWRIVFNTFREALSENSASAQYVALFSSAFPNILPVRIPHTTFVRQAIDMGVSITASKAKRKLHESLSSFIDLLVADLGTPRS